MLIIETKNYKEMSKRAASLISDIINDKPDAVIGFATGKTPLGLYKELVDLNKKKKIDFSKVTSFNLDEYYPIKKNDMNSYYTYMHKNLFDKINIKKQNINLLNGETKKPKEECSSYEKKLRKNKIDIQILGLGVNGHIGFNEPGSEFNSKTRLVKLSPETIEINKKKLNDRSEIPWNALSMGIKSIMSAKKIILLASGKNKARAIKELIEGKIRSDYPATFLKKHKDLIVIIDKEAGSLLRK
ncbi:MAG: glucosamine-6-phosphate deaminase [Candidatus Pacearchaeota archaeon]|jgi:glucosamine-6-phosphate deaminase